MESCLGGGANDSIGLLVKYSKPPPSASLEQLNWLEDADELPNDWFLRWLEIMTPEPKITKRFKIEELFKQPAKSKLKLVRLIIKKI